MIRSQSKTHLSDKTNSLIEGFKSKRRPLSLSMSVNNIHNRYFEKSSSKDNVIKEKDNNSKRVSNREIPKGSSKESLKESPRESPRELQKETSNRENTPHPVSKQPSLASIGSDSEISSKSPYTPDDIKIDDATINLTTIPIEEEMKPKNVKRTSNLAQIMDMINLINFDDSNYHTIDQHHQKEQQELQEFNGVDTYGIKMIGNFISFDYQQEKPELDLDIDYDEAIKLDYFDV